MNAMRRMLDAVEEREIRRIALSRSSITFAAAFMIRDRTAEAGCRGRTCACRGLSARSSGGRIWMEEIGSARLLHEADIGGASRICRRCFAVPSS
jgi:hypothetical protein